MSNDYWEKREQDHIQKLQKGDAAYNAELEKRYKQAMHDIRAQINDFYVRYADKEGISLADAKKKVRAEDVQAFADTAKQITKEKDFSPEANEKLRLYNATMRINRLEMLKSQIGLELIKLSNDEDAELSAKLKQEYVDEYQRQAGILGENKVNNFPDDVDMVVNGSFHNATFSDRIWANQDNLKSFIDSALTIWLIRGDKPTDRLADELSKQMNVSKNAAQVLMLTESSRISTEAEKRALTDAGVEYFWVVGKADACDECQQLINKSHTKPLKVADIKVGTNAPPVHPRCRCVMSAAAEDWDDWNQWLDDKSLPPSPYWKKDNAKVDYLGGNLRSTLDSIDDGLSTKAVTKALEAVPENMQKMWRCYKDRMQVEQLNRGRGSNFYHPGSRQVTLSTDNILGVNSGDYQKPYDVVFHEFGHMIDHFAAKTIYDKASEYMNTSGLGIYDIPNTMKQDYNNFMKQYVDRASKIRLDSNEIVDDSQNSGSTWYIKDDNDARLEVKFKKDGTLTKASIDKVAQHMMVTEIQSEYDIKARGDVSDMMTVPSGKDYMLGVGHTKKYFTYPGHQETEMFAEMTSATVNDPESLELIKKVFPESYKKYEQMVDDIIKAGENNDG